MENIKVHCSYTELVDPEMLVPNPRNPNQHPKRQIELLAKIIQTQGWRAPVTVSNRSGFIVRGHGRLAAAMLLGCKVPVERQDYASEAEEWADLVADNRIAELASIDTEEMARLLSDLSGLDIDIELTGYAGKALDNLLADVRAQEVREDDFDTAGTAASIKEPIEFREAMAAANWTLKQCLIWVKNQFVIGRQDYQWQHEPILYGWRTDGRHSFFGGRKQGTVLEDLPIVIQEQEDHALICVAVGLEQVVIRARDVEVVSRADDSIMTAWRFEKPIRNGEHPTMKPIALCARAIQNSSRPGDIVLDGFGGSGSTLIAAEQTGRRCFSMECDPVYADVIVRRWEEFTGQRAERIKDGVVDAEEGKEKDRNS